eukprot:27910_1
MFTMVKIFAILVILLNLLEIADCSSNSSDRSIFKKCAPPRPERLPAHTRIDACFTQLECQVGCVWFYRPLRTYVLPKLLCLNGSWTYEHIPGCIFGWTNSSGTDVGFAFQGVILATIQFLAVALLCGIRFWQLRAISRFPPVGHLAAFPSLGGHLARASCSACAAVLSVGMGAVSLGTNAGQGVDSLVEVFLMGADALTWILSLALSMSEFSLGLCPSWTLR